MLSAASLTFPHRNTARLYQWCFSRVLRDVNVRESDLSHNVTYKRREKRLEKCLTIAIIMASSNGYTMSDKGWHSLS